MADSRKRARNWLFVISDPVQIAKTDQSLATLLCSFLLPDNQGGFITYFVFQREEGLEAEREHHQGLLCLPKGMSKSALLRKIPASVRRMFRLRAGDGKFPSMYKYCSSDRTVKPGGRMEGHDVMAGLCCAACNPCPWYSQGKEVLVYMLRQETNTVIVCAGGLKPCAGKRTDIADLALSLKEDPQMTYFDLSQRHGSAAAKVGFIEKLRGELSKKRDMNIPHKGAVAPPASTA